MFNCFLTLSCLQYSRVSMISRFMSPRLTLANTLSHCVHRVSLLERFPPVCIYTLSFLFCFTGNYTQEPRLEGQTRLTPFSASSHAPWLIRLSANTWVTGRKCAGGPESLHFSFVFFRQRFFNRQRLSDSRRDDRAAKSNDRSCSWYHVADGSVSFSLLNKMQAMPTKSWQDS